MLERVFEPHRPGDALQMIALEQRDLRLAQWRILGLSGADNAQQQRSADQRIVNNGSPSHSAVPVRGFAHSSGALPVWRHDTGDIFLWRWSPPRRTIPQLRSLADEKRRCPEHGPIPAAMPG